MSGNLYSRCRGSLKRDIQEPYTLTSDTGSHIASSHHSNAFTLHTLSYEFNVCKGIIKQRWQGKLTLTTFFNLSSLVLCKLTKAWLTENIAMYPRLTSLRSVLDYDGNFSGVKKTTTIISEQRICGLQFKECNQTAFTFTSSSRGVWNPHNSHMGFI